MEYAESILELMGGAPLVRLSRITRDLGPIDRQPLILAKMEMLNPGGSVKDRIGLPMIEAAEREGKLRPGGTIIEPTSGNTGHGLAIAAALKGYRCIFVMADKQSAEKQALLRAYGAEVVLCPSNVAPESPESYYSVARRLARDIPGAYQPDQYSNMNNPAAHERSTGPEIWRQTDGRITHFVTAVGTGGTVTGVAHYLRTHKQDLVVVGADPEGSVLSGDTARPYLTEGIGEDFFPGTFDPKSVDRWVRVSDRDSFAMARRITREEGILAGESSGTAIVAALAVARELTESDGGHEAVMVVLLPDTGRNYISKLYNDEWLRANGLLGFAPGRATVASLFDAGRDGALPPLVLARTSDSVATAIDMMDRYGISQMPVSEREDDTIEGIVGAISEKSLLERAYRDPAVVERTVGEVMERPLPTIEASESLEDAFQLLA
ncbi:MAG TPA: pyridoxal-phosphate dependent enzyme, partial [Candidatus Caenarcaniphilales bacterium]|nr:pyridoxal-phosphate dependent enzyme [Candidatus Caenarcaniphilales bacterium]